MDNELLKAISEIMDQKLEPISKRLDKIESRLDILEYKQDRTAKKLDDLQLDIKIAERDIRRDIYSLKDETETTTQLLRIHELIPQ